MQLIVPDMATEAEQPNLAEISAFLAVVQGESFSTAASALGVAKSSISRRVAALEAKLEAQLLHRTTRRLGLTEVGEAYHAEVLGAMGRMRDAADSVRKLKTVPRGRLRITAPSDMGANIAALVQHFVVAYPQVHVEVELTQRTVDLVAERVDLALRAGTLADSSLIAQRAVTAGSFVVSTPAYLARAGTPTTPDELAEHTFVLFKPKAGRQTLTLKGPGGVREVVVRGSVSGNDFSFVHDVLLEGEGIGTVPPQVAASSLRSGRLVRVLPRWELPNVSLFVVYPSRTHLPAKVRVFRDFAIQWLQQQNEALLQEIQ